jgi:hypothetical protein
VFDYINIAALEVLRRASGDEEPMMAKGQKRSNREAKKPKQPKPERSGALTGLPASRDAASPGERSRTDPRNGRR